jgi:hypothetical protein
VVRRVLERAELRSADRKPEKVLRRGITMVPKTGVRVVQERAPAAASVADAVEPAAAA